MSLAPQTPFWRLPPLVAESEEMLHLDVLRLIAACGIVLCHSLEFLAPLGSRDEIHARSAGLPLFVDVFFVVSGYVITAVYGQRMQGWASYGVFIKRRIARLYPLHLATLLAAGAIALAVRGAGLEMAHPPSLSGSCFLTTALLAHSVIECGGRPLNGISWSISAEMIMYLAFPVLLFVAQRPWRIGLLAVAGFALVGWIYGDIALWAGHLNFGRAVPAFCLGMFLHTIRHRLVVPMPGLLLAMASLAMIVGSFLLWPMAVLLALAYLLPVFAIAADANGVAGKLTARLAPYGRLTYSIYMLHGLVILVVLNGVADKVLHVGMPVIAVVMLAVFGIIGVGARLSLEFFETPLRRWIDGIRPLSRYGISSGAEPIDPSAGKPIAGKGERHV